MKEKIKKLKDPKIYYIKIVNKHMCIILNKKLTLTLYMIRYNFIRFYFINYLFNKIPIILYYK